MNVHSTRTWFWDILGSIYIPPISYGTEIDKYVQSRVGMRSWLRRQILRTSFVTSTSRALAVMFCMYSWVEVFSKYLKGIKMCLDQGTAPCASLLKKSSTKSLMVSAANCLATRCLLTNSSWHVVETQGSTCAMKFFFSPPSFDLMPQRVSPKPPPCFHRLALPPCRG